MSHLSDKFFAAVRVLAGEGPVKTRLVAAYRENLDMLPEEELPSSIRGRFGSLREAMHAVKPLPSENSIVASVRKMSTADASRCATQIVAMYSELTQMPQSTTQPLRVVATKTEVEENLVVPPSALN